MGETRNALRSAALSRRNALPPAACLSWSRSIQANAIEFPRFESARCAALYCAVGNEVETRGLMDHALQRGKKVFCPKFSRAGAAVFVELESGGDLIVGGFGIPEPPGDRLLSPEDCEGLIVFVPGVLFDRWGNRLGRGGGWYDRALEWLDGRGLFVGLAYDCQVVDSLPAQVWDRKVHYVITESKVIDCAVASSSQAAR